MCQNSNCETTLKFKLKNQIVTKSKIQEARKLKNSNIDKLKYSNSNKTFKMYWLKNCD